MKKSLLFASLSLLAFAGILLFGCGKPAQSGKTFTVGFDAEFPPYGYKDAKTGEYTGFDLELAQEVCNRKGWKLVKKPIDWNSKDLELSSGSIDCIWNGFTINGREKNYTFTKPYVDNSQVILVKAGSPINKLTDLAGKQVAAQTDTPVLKALQKGGDCEKLGATFKKMVITPNYNNAVMELESGAVDAVAMDIGVAKEKMSKAPGKFRMLSEIVMSEEYGVGFKLGNTALRDEVEAEMKKLAADGTAAKISAKYFDGKNVFILK